MRVEDLGQAVERRVSAFVESGDTAAVLDPAAITEAEALWAATVGASGSIPALLLRALALLHLCRYQANTVDHGAFATAMNLFQQLLRGRPDLVPEGPRQLIAKHSDDPEDLYALARLAFGSYQAGALDELEPALDLLRRALAATRPDDPHRADVTGGLAATLCAGYERTGCLDDLDESIAAGRMAVELGGPGLPLHLSNLGVSLRDRYYATGVDDDLNESVHCAESAVHSEAAATDRVMFQTMLALSLRARGEKALDRHDLDRAVQLLDAVVAATPPEDPRAGDRRASLRSVMMTRYQIIGDPQDLDRIVALARSWLEDLDQGSPVRSDAVAGLAEALHGRYGWLGDPTDLHAAVAVLRETPDSAGRLLADLLRDRYARFGDLADLDEAVTLLDAELAGLPTPSPAVAGLLSHLGTALRQRFTANGDETDLDRAVAVARSAADMSTLRHSDRLNHGNNLAGALETRYRSRQDPADLREAVEIMRAVVTRTPPGGRYRAGRMGNLAGLLIELGDPASIGEAVGLAETAAVTESARNPADRWYYQHWLARAYAARYRSAGTEADLRVAATAYREATGDDAAAAPDRLSSAQGWLALTAGAHDWPGAVDAAVAAVDLLPRSAWRGLDRTGRERVLRADGATLGVDGVAVALHARRPELAVDLSERGRAVQWSQLLEVRGDLERLRAVAPDLAARLTDVAALLALAEAQA